MLPEYQTVKQAYNHYITKPVEKKPVKTILENKRLLMAGENMRAGRMHQLSTREEEALQSVEKTLAEEDKMACNLKESESIELNSIGRLRIRDDWKLTEDARSRLGTGYDFLDVSIIGFLNRGNDHDLVDYRDGINKLPYGCEEPAIWHRGDMPFSSAYRKEHPASGMFYHYAEIDLKSNHLEKYEHLAVVLSSFQDIPGNFTSYESAKVSITDATEGKAHKEPPITISCKDIHEHKDKRSMVIALISRTDSGWTIKQPKSENAFAGGSVKDYAPIKSKCRELLGYAQWYEKYQKVQVRMEIPKKYQSTPDEQFIWVNAKIEKFFKNKNIYAVTFFRFQ